MNERSTYRVTGMNEGYSVERAFCAPGAEGDAETQTQWSLMSRWESWEAAEAERRVLLHPGPDASLWMLAAGAVNPASAGACLPITIENLGLGPGAMFRCRITRPDAPQTEDEERLPARAFPPVVWEGPISTWIEALTEAALRPAFPGAEGAGPWQPGPYEAAARAA